MDDETRAEFREVDKRFAEVDSRMIAMENRIVSLIEQVADSLKNEMREMRTEMRERSDRMETRMDRIGGLVNGGSRAIARLAEWPERTDQFQMDTLRRLNHLDQRVSKIESQNKN